MSSSRNLVRAVAALARSWGGLKRGELAAELALSRPTVTGLVDDLKSLGWAEETRQRLFLENLESRSSLGRPETFIRLTEAAGFVAAIHAGHTTVRALVASNQGIVGESKRLTDYNVDEAGPVALGRGLDLVAESLREASIPVDQLRAISVGIPAPINVRKGSVASSTFMKSWAQTDLRAAISGLVRDRLGSGERLPQVFVENEANAMARGAYARGLVGDAENFLLLKVSSGIGAGLVLGGEVYDGPSGGAGEFGHLQVRGKLGELEMCPRCLRFGCIETIASADAIVRRLRLSSPEYPADTRPSTIVDNARDPVRHPECHRAIVEAGKQIGEVLAGVVSFLDLEKVLVSGVLAEAGDLLLDPMREVLSKQALNFIRPEVVGLNRAARREVGLYGGIVHGLAKTQPLFLSQIGN